MQQRRSPTFTILGVDAGVSSDDGSPARDGGRTEPAVLGREKLVEATAKDAAVEGRDRAAAKEDAAGLENMVCQVMPSEQSLQVDDEKQRPKGLGRRLEGRGFTPALQELRVRSGYWERFLMQTVRTTATGFKRKPCAVSDSEPGYLWSAFNRSQRCSWGSAMCANDMGAAVAVTHPLLL